MAERVYLTIAEVMAIHHHRIEQYGGIHGLAIKVLWSPRFFAP
jgi:hypothetical protein